MRRLMDTDSAAPKQVVKSGKVGDIPMQTLGVDFDNIENHYEALADSQCDYYGKTACQAQRPFNEVRSP
jgi:hypothetical protein